MRSGAVPDAFAATGVRYGWLRSTSSATARPTGTRKAASRAAGHRSERRGRDAGRPPRPSGSPRWRAPGSPGRISSRARSSGRGGPWRSCGRPSASTREGYRSDPRLREIGFGAWEGSTWAEIRRRDPGRGGGRATATAGATVRPASAARATPCWWSASRPAIAGLDAADRDRRPWRRRPGDPGGAGPSRHPDAAPRIGIRQGERPGPGAGRLALGVSPPARSTGVQTASITA